MGRQIRAGIKPRSTVVGAIYGKFHRRRKKGKPEFSKGFLKEFKGVIIGAKSPEYRTTEKERINRKLSPLINSVIKKYWVPGENKNYLKKIGHLAGLTGMKKYKMREVDLADKDNRKLVTYYIEYGIYQATRIGQKYVPLKNISINQIARKNFKVGGDGFVKESYSGLDFNKILEEEKKFESEIFGVSDTAIKPLPHLTAQFIPHIDYLADLYASTKLVNKESLVKAGNKGAEEAVLKYRANKENLNYNKKAILRHIEWNMRNTLDLAEDNILGEALEDENFENNIQSYQNRKSKLKHFLEDILFQPEYEKIEQFAEKISRENILNDRDALDLGMDILKEKIPHYKDKNLWDLKYDGIWKGEKALEYAAKATKWLIEEKLKIPLEVAAKELRPEHFKKYGLSNMLRIVFNGSLYKAIVNAFPEKILREDVDKRYRRALRKGKYEGEEGRKIAAQEVRDLFKRLNIPEEKIPYAVSARLFFDNKASTLLETAYRGSTYRAIEAAYPGKFKPWEFKRRPRGIWQGKDAYRNAAEATKWLIEEKLKISSKEAPDKLTRDAFIEHGLSGMLHLLFGWDPYRALINAYPKKYSVDDFQKAEEKKKTRFAKVGEEDTMFIIKKYEPLAKYLAYRSSAWSKMLDYDDLVQMGRIGTWFAIRDLGLTKRNFEKYKKPTMHYISNTISGAIREGYDRILDFSSTLDNYVFKDSRKRPFEEVISEKQKELFGELILTSKQKKLRFYGTLKETLSEEKYKELEGEIGETLTRLETKQTFDNINWDPIEEALDLLRKHIPRYKDIRKWELKGGRHLWGGEVGRRLAKQATRHLFEEKLKIPEGEIPEVSSARLFQDNKLGGMLIQVYHGMPFLAVEDAYPGKFNPWEFKNRPHLWGTRGGMRYAAEATRWLVEEKLGIPPNEALKKITRKDFVDHRLLGMLFSLFKGKGHYHAISNAYPELFPAYKIHEFLDFVNSNLSRWGYKLTHNREINFIRDIDTTNPDWDPIQEGIKALKKEIPLYKNENPWQFNYKNKWTRENSLEIAKDAVRWIVGKEGISNKKIPEKISEKTFSKYGLDDMLRICFRNSVYNAMDHVYPGSFNPWDFRLSYQGVWKGQEGLELAKKAVQHHFEKKLKAPVEKMLGEMSLWEIGDSFRENGLEEMTRELFNNSPYRALRNAYPDIRPWEYEKQKNIFRGKEGLEIAADAIKWMVGKEGISTEKIPKRVKEGALEKYGLSRIVSHFDGSVYKAIDNAYPYTFKLWEFMEAKEWNKDDKYLAREAIKWMVEQKLKIPVREIPKHVTTKTFYHYGLGGMFDKLFDGSLHKAIENAYPNIFNSWEIRRNGMWQGKEGLYLAARAVRHVVEEEGIPVEEVPKKLTYNLLKKYKLAGMLTACFGGHLYEAIDNAYPASFKPWKFGQKNIWRGKNGSKNIKDAIEWLVEEKLKISPHESPEKIEKITRYDFKKHGLGGLIQHFDYSPYKAINHVYPNRFKPWEFTRTQIWEGGNGDGMEMAKEAVKWLVDEKLKIPEEEIPSKVKKSTFEEYKLGGMLSICFDNSPYEAINHSYTNRFKPWEFKCPNSYWQGDKGRNHAIESTKWLIEEKLKIPLEEVPKMSKDTAKDKFKEHGLGGMLYILFNMNPYKAFINAYPKTFSVESFPKGSINNNYSPSRMAQ